jgi:hypothetical protein
MAQPADGLTMEEAHTKIKTKITEIEGFIQQHKTVGSLCSERRAEAGDLRRKLEHRLSILKIFWYAEPDEDKFEELSNWITDVGDEVQRTLNVMEVFMKVREMRLLTEHDAGVKTITDPAGVDVVLQSTEATTNTQTGLNNDTVEMRGTLTPRAGDTEEPRFTLRPKDMSKLIAIPTGQFNPRFDELVDHPGGA